MYPRSSKTLKPGGWLELGDYTENVFFSDDRPIDPPEDWEWLRDTGWREAAEPGSRHKAQLCVVYGGSWLRGRKKVGVQSTILEGGGEGDAGLREKHGACGW